MTKLKQHLIWPLALVAGLSGCDANRDSADTALTAMLETDRAFAEKAATDGAPAAFAAYAADSVRMFPQGGLPYDGHDKLVERFGNWPDTAMLSWTPKGGVASSSGDFGYTWGLSVYRSIDENGDATADHGKYISIWRKEADGAWKFVADMGNAAPAPDAGEPDL